MHFEYQMLALMTLLFLFAWIPTSIGKYYSYGWKWLASNRKPIEGKTLLPWAARCENAYSNLKDYFPAYVVAILLLGATNKFDNITEYASLAYVIGRVIHYAAYAYGSVNIRFIAYLVAMSSNVILILKLLIPE